MTGIILFSTAAWRFGLPTSESHALIAGLTGAGLAKAGAEVLVLDGWIKVGKGLLFSTFFGFGGGLLIMVAVYWVFQRCHQGRIRCIFGRLQILSAAFMAFTHGSNDGQKFMAPFTLALWLGGLIPENEAPTWVIVLCAVTMGMGMMFGGMGRSDDSEEGGANPLALLFWIIVAPMAAMLIQFAISRSREYAADDAAARISGRPLSLANALRRLEHAAEVLPTHTQPATAHMFIVNPLRGGGIASLFSTHPPVAERVARLEAMAAYGETSFLRTASH